MDNVDEIKQTELVLVMDGAAPVADFMQVLVSCENLLSSKNPFSSERQKLLEHVKQTAQKFPELVDGTVLEGKADFESLGFSLIARDTNGYALWYNDNIHRAALEHRL